jgi:hypothetical protein
LSKFSAISQKISTLVIDWLQKNVRPLELKYNLFLFLNAGAPLVLEGGNSTSYAA